MISYPKLSNFRTLGLTKWLAKSFSEYLGFSMKELYVKPSSGKGHGKSNGIRREEVLTILSKEEYKIGFPNEKDPIKAKAVQEVPTEVLEQLEREEREKAKVDA